MNYCLDKSPFLVIFGSLDAYVMLTTYIGMEINLLVRVGGVFLWNILLVKRGGDCMT